MRFQTTIQLIAGDVAQSGERLQFGHETRSPFIELLRVGIFKAVLELRPAHAIFHRQVLNRLHEKLNALHLGQFRLQPPDLEELLWPAPAGDRPWPGKKPFETPRKPPGLRLYPEPGRSPWG